MCQEAGGKGCRVMKDIALNLSNRNDGNTRDVSMVIKKKSWSGKCLCRFINFDFISFESYFLCFFFGFIWEGFPSLCNTVLNGKLRWRNIIGSLIRVLGACGHSE